MTSSNLTRAGIAGALLAGAAVILFLVIWFLLAGSGMSDASRLFTAMCLPPAALGALLIVYALYTRGRAASAAASTDSESPPPEEPPTA